MRVILVLVVDHHHAKQVDMKKIKESTVYNYKVQFEPEISFLQNLDKLGDDKNFDIKDLIKNLNTVEEKKPQETNSPTDVDDLDFALPTVLPPVTPPILLTTISTVSSVSTDITTKLSVPITIDMPEVTTESSKPIELPPSKTAQIESVESVTEVVATTVTASRETEGVKSLEREEESDWTTAASYNPPVFQPTGFNFMSSMFPFYNVAQHQCQCHQVVFIPQWYLLQGMYGFKWPTFGGGYNYHTNINNGWRPYYFSKLQQHQKFTP